VSPKCLKLKKRKERSGKNISHQRGNEKSGEKNLKKGVIKCGPQKGGGEDEKQIQGGIF